MKSCSRLVGRHSFTQQTLTSQKATISLTGTAFVTQPGGGGGFNSKKCCFRKKIFRESEDFTGNWET